MDRVDQFIFISEITIDTTDANVSLFGNLRNRRAMKTLDPEIRSLLWLKEVEGLEISELGRILEVPEGTLKSRLSRSREKLRQWMEKEARYAT